MQWRLVEQAAAETGWPVPLRFLKTTDCLRSVAGAARRPALFPQLFPIPDPGRHLVRQPESELMREHTHLPAMVGFVRKHVAQHFQANRPRPSPAVSAKLLDAAPTTAERFSEHLRAASGALGQSRTGLLRRAVRAVELWWNLQVRSCKPDPLGADIVHVREDRRNGADLSGRFGSPGGRVKMFDKNLVHAIIGGKDLDCGSAELSVNLVLTRGHGSLLLDLIILPGRRPSRIRVIRHPEPARRLASWLFHAADWRRICRCCLPASSFRSPSAWISCARPASISFGVM